MKILHVHTCSVKLWNVVIYCCAWCLSSAGGGGQAPNHVPWLKLPQKQRNNLSSASRSDSLHPSKSPESAQKSPECRTSLLDAGFLNCQGVQQQIHGTFSTPENLLPWGKLFQTLKKRPIQCQAHQSVPILTFEIIWEDMLDQPNESKWFPWICPKSPESKFLNAALLSWTQGFWTARGSNNKSMEPSRHLKTFCLGENCFRPQEATYPVPGSSISSNSYLSDPLRRHVRSTQWIHMIPLNLPKVSWIEVPECRTSLLDAGFLNCKGVQQQIHGTFSTPENLLPWGKLLQTLKKRPIQCQAHQPGPNFLTFQILWETC